MFCDLWDVPSCRSSLCRAIVTVLGVEALLDQYLCLYLCDRPRYGWISSRGARWHLEHVGLLVVLGQLWTSLREDGNKVSVAN